MKKCGVLVWILMFCVPAFAQDAITTIILVRHAEKSDDGTRDPDLSAAGNERAGKLAAVLRDTKVDAVYSTDYKRTRDTAAPVAEAKGLRVQLYEPLRPEVIREILKNHDGKTILVTGHSNTIPWTANLLLGREEFKNFDDMEYDNLLVVSVFGSGPVASVVRLHY